MQRHSIFSKLLKDPLLHFLLIGIGIFGLFSQLNSEEEPNNLQQIIIDQSTLNILSDDFMKDNARAPTHKEMQTLIESDIREEILYREAIVLGLDKDDRIIRHRLAQKTKYLFEDVALLDDPNDTVLKVYLKENSEKYKNSSGKLPKYNELKEKLKRDWIAKEQKKENDAFYKNLKSRYTIMVRAPVLESLNESTAK